MPNWTPSWRDFRELPPGIPAPDPDAFLMELREQDPYAMVSALRRRCARKPVGLNQLESDSVTRRVAGHFAAVLRDCI